MFVRSPYVLCKYVSTIWKTQSVLNIIYTSRSHNEFNFLMRKEFRRVEFRGRENAISDWQNSINKTSETYFRRLIGDRKNPRKRAALSFWLRKHQNRKRVSSGNCVNCNFRRGFIWKSYYCIVCGVLKRKWQTTFHPTSWLCETNNNRKSISINMYIGLFIYLFHRTILKHRTIIPRGFFNYHNFPEKVYSF